jgi:hypothetical protein
MCFGANQFGQLGYEDTIARTMPTTPVDGDAYPIVNVGSGRTVKRVFAMRDGMYSGDIGVTCAILDSTSPGTNNTLRCW